MSWIISFIYGLINTTFFSLISAFIFILFVSLFINRLVGKVIAINIKFFFIFLIILVIVNVVLGFYFIFSNSVFLYTLPIHFTSNTLFFIGILMAIWLVGVIINIYPYIFYLITFRKKIDSIMTLNEIRDMEVTNLLNYLKNELGIKCKIRVIKMNGLPAPAVFQIHQPIILLPENVETAIDLKVILTHELIHIKNKDLLYKFLGKVLTSFFWFNPIIFCGARLLNQYMEFACDEMACVSGKQLFTMREYFSTVFKFKKIL